LGSYGFREGLDCVPRGRFTSEQAGDFVVIDENGCVTGPALKVSDPVQPPIHNRLDDDTGSDLEPLRGF
jgi:hypothetical protein